MVKKKALWCTVEKNPSALHHHTQLLLLLPCLLLLLSLRLQSVAVPTCHMLWQSCLVPKSKSHCLRLAENASPRDSGQPEYPHPIFIFHVSNPPNPSQGIVSIPPNNTHHCSGGNYTTISCIVCYLNRQQYTVCGFFSKDWTLSTRTIQYSSNKTLSENLQRLMMMPLTDILVQQTAGYYRTIDDSTAHVLCTPTVARTQNHTLNKGYSIRSCKPVFLFVVGYKILSSISIVFLTIHSHTIVSEEKRTQPTSERL